MCHKKSRTCLECKLSHLDRLLRQIIRLITYGLLVSFPVVHDEQHQCTCIFLARSNAYGLLAVHITTTEKEQNRSERPQGKAPGAQRPERTR